MLFQQEIDDHPRILSYQPTSQIQYQGISYRLIDHQTQNQSISYPLTDHRIPGLHYMLYELNRTIMIYKDIFPTFPMFLWKIDFT